MTTRPQGPVEVLRARVGDGVLQLLEQELSQSELTTLLLSIASTRANQVDVRRLLSRSAHDRFTRPATADPRELVALEHRLWDALPDKFTGLDLSPVAPLGICAAVASVDQNQVVTTVRGNEVVSDATNVLALEAARLRAADRTRDVHLACGHRLLRGQHFGAGASAHFRLFQLVSSGRDRGSGRAEAAMMLAQLGYWATLLRGLLPAGVPWHFAYTVFQKGAGSERLLEEVVPALAERGAAWRELPNRTGASYYGEVAFKIFAQSPDGEVELGDGGLTDWTGRLMNDHKERTLISCIATERLLTLLASTAG